MKKTIGRYYPVLVFVGLFLFAGATEIFSQTGLDDTGETVETLPDAEKTEAVPPNGEDSSGTEKTVIDETGTPESIEKESSVLDQPGESPTEVINTDETDSIETNGKVESTSVKPRKSDKKGNKKKVIAKTKKNSPLEQFRWTPEDPSFLYETRYLPGQVVEQEFLSVEQEKEVAEERIEEERNFQESLDKLDFQLPEPGKLAFVIITVIIVVIYRIQVNKAKKKRGKF